MCLIRELTTILLKNFPKGDYFNKNNLLNLYRNDKIWIVFLKNSFIASLKHQWSVSRAKLVCSDIEIFFSNCIMYHFQIILEMKWKLFRVSIKFSLPRIYSIFQIKFENNLSAVVNRNWESKLYLKWSVRFLLHQDETFFHLDLVLK